MRAFQYLFLIAVFIGFRVQATIVKLADLHTMAKRSDVVIHGFIGEQRVVTDELGRLITLTDVEVIDGFYGAKNGEVITIYQVGGKRDGLVMPLLGGQNYSVGQQLYFFGLKVDDAYVSYGAGQGKLDVVKEVTGDVVVEDLGNVATIVNTAFGPSIVHPSPLNFPDPLIFKEELKLMLE